MPSGGNSVLVQLELGQPFFLIDENLSHLYARVFEALGFNITSLREAFSGRRSVKDEELIPWLGKQGQHHAVWITQDILASKTHAKLILAHSISILWIRSRKKQELTGLQELQLLSMVIAHVRDLVASSATPLYLWALLVGRRPKLEKLTSSLTSKKLEFQKIQIPV